MSEKKISEIQKEYKETSELLLPDFIEEYINDGRPGVSKIIGMAQKRMEKLRIERERIEHLKEFENQYWPEFDYIGGIDEVGRGPLAGPVVTACVVLPKDCSILYINDSKKLSASKRDELYEIIMKEAVSVGIGVCSEQRIDEINILQATYEAMRQAISECSVEPQVLLNDAVTIPEVKIKQVPIIKGDAKSISIGAASIIAKVTRDRMMVEYDSIYPEYHFASNKGYGSAEHIEALKKYGPCPIHRRSFIGNFV
ncbi:MULTISPECIES: ribonuclease HII [unclassified Pseudobutyrivibrio]|jgi:ribonuclease HII|uniref:ribonuclease HII n=1 Tax=unclassified Pseudobutyrivibrio TaxID=2638619 RepID=UPI0005D1D127|nr:MULTISPECIES: ribonuclease HII [unclassified Pseudobutyrivibrio]SFO03181.1 RNase HII [Pseudobutyrivibrio sp. JW11]